jgi:hypothetical protein
MNNLNESEEKIMNEVISKGQYDEENKNKPISKEQFEKERLNDFLFELARLYEKYHLTYDEIDFYLTTAVNEALRYGKSQKFKLEK